MIVFVAQTKLAFVSPNNIPSSTPRTSRNQYRLRYGQPKRKTILMWPILN